MVIPRNDDDVSTMCPVYRCDRDDVSYPFRYRGCDFSDFPDYDGDEESIDRCHHGGPRDDVNYCGAYYAFPSFQGDGQSYDPHPSLIRCCDVADSVHYDDVGRHRKPPITTPQ